MFRRLYRQRRRILLFMALFSLAFAVITVGDTELRYVIKNQMAGQTGLYLAIAAGLVIIGSALSSALIVLLFPALRRSLEAAGLALLLHAMLGRWVFSAFSWTEDGMATWLSFFVIFYAISFALERDVFRNAGLKLRYTARAARVMSAKPAALWAAMAPTLETMGTYWTKSLIRVEPRPDLGPDSHEVHFRLGPFGTLIQRHDRGTWNWPYGFDYTYRPLDDGLERIASRGTYRVSFLPEDNGKTRVSAEHDIVDLGIGTWLLLWLDDTARSELDAVEAAMTGRADWSIAGWQARKMARA